MEDGDDRASQRPFVLRQPRLKISSSIMADAGGVDSAAIMPSGPFSFVTGSASPIGANKKVNFDGTPSIFSTSGATFGSAAVSTTFACDVCKVPNTPASQISRKFGAYNCEACRKFISKMSKKSTASSAGVNPVTCARGDGNCVISSDKGKDRCAACLLKSCLKTYNLPLKFRLKLHLLLPHAMKIADKAQLDGFHKKIKSTANAAAAAAAVVASSVVPESSNLFATAVHSTNSKILVDKTETTDAAGVAGSTEPFKSISTKSISLPNPLAENNPKFGSQPAIKPTIIDKPIIMSPKVLKEAVENEQVSFVLLGLSLKN